MTNNTQPDTNTTNEPVSAESFDIQGTPELVISQIKDQADNIEKSWREAVTNCLDAPGSTNAWLWWNEQRSIITDDGDGAPMTEADKRKLVTHMGASTKHADDDDTIGRFGIGKGQYYAKARVTIITQANAIHFNIEDWGIKNGARMTDAADAAVFAAQHDTDWGDHVREGLTKHKGGFTVVLSHYDDETPDRHWRWQNHADSLTSRFKYASKTTGVDVYVDDTLISDEPLTNDLTLIPERSDRVLTDTLTTDTTGRVDVALELKAEGDIDVHSNGVFVRSLDSDAFTGVILTHNNLDLNFARNEIKSGCPIWNAVRDHVDELKLTLCRRTNTNKLPHGARAYVAKRMAADTTVFDNWEDEPVYRGVDDEYYSVTDVETAPQIGYGRRGDTTATNVMDDTDMLVLDDYDDAVTRVKQLTNSADTAEHTHDENDAPTLSTNEADVDTVANDNELVDTPETVTDTSLEPRQQQKLAVARRLAAHISTDKTVSYGESHTQDAWTDGHSNVVITDSAAPGSSWKIYVPQLYDALVTQIAYNTDTEGGNPKRSRRDRKRYIQTYTTNTSARTDVLTEIEHTGIRAFTTDTL